MKDKGGKGLATSEQGRNKTLATAVAVILVLVAAVVVATTGDSWAVKMILSIVALDIAVRLYRWGER